MSEFEDIDAKSSANLRGRDRARAGGIPERRDYRVEKKAFKQRQTREWRDVRKTFSSDRIYDFSNLAFIRKRLAAGGVEALAASCTYLAYSYARALRMAKAHAAGFALFVAAHKQLARLTDASHWQRAITVKAAALPQRRRVMALVVEAVPGAPGTSEDALGREFKKVLK